MRIRNQGLLDERAAFFSPINATGVYNMRLEGDKQRLAVDVWRGNFSDSMRELRHCNPQLVQMIRAQISNKSNITEHSQAVTERLKSNILEGASRVKYLSRGSLSLGCLLARLPLAWHGVHGPRTQGPASAIG